MTAFKRSQAKYVKGKCKITPESVFLNRNSTDSSLCAASTSDLAAHLDATSMENTTLRIVTLGLLTASVSCSSSETGGGGAIGTGTGGTATTPQGGSFSGALGGSSGSTGSVTSNQATGGNSVGGAGGGGNPPTGGNRATGGVTESGGARQTGGADSGTGGANKATGGGGTIGGAMATGGARTGTGGVAAGGTGAGGIAVGGVSATGGAATTVVGGSAGGASGTPSSGCGKTPTLASGSRTIQSGGQSRQYMIRIPDNYDNSHPYRLIFAFHWNGGTMGDIDGGGSSGAAWSYYGLREQANNSTIFVAPQGISNGWANSGGRDLTLVDDLIKLIEGDLCVDTTQLFSVGFSYGGGMTYELACARATVFRAAAVYSGAQLSGCDGGKDPIAYLGIHGVSDGTCGIAGGRSLRDTFVKNNGCTAQNPPEPATGSGTHTCTKYQGCSAGHPVEWCAFDGGHTPGNVDGGGDDGAKTWTKAEVWKFFTQFQ